MLDLSLLNCSNWQTLKLSEVTDVLGLISAAVKLCKSTHMHYCALKILVRTHSPEQMVVCKYA